MRGKGDEFNCGISPQQSRYMMLCSRSTTNGATPPARDRTPVAGLQSGPDACVASSELFAERTNGEVNALVTAPMGGRRNTYKPRYKLYQKGSCLEGVTRCQNQGNSGRECSRNLAPQTWIITSSHRSSQWKASRGRFFNQSSV